MKDDFVKRIAALDESAGEFYQLSRGRSASLYRAREALRSVVSGKAKRRGDE